MLLLLLLLLGFVSLPKRSGAAAEEVPFPSSSSSRGGGGAVVGSGSSPRGGGGRSRLLRGRPVEGTTVAAEEILWPPSPAGTAAAAAEWAFPKDDANDGAEGGSAFLRSLRVANGEVEGSEPAPPPPPPPPAPSPSPSLAPPPPSPPSWLSKPWLDSDVASDSSSSKNEADRRDTYVVVGFITWSFFLFLCCVFPMARAYLRRKRALAMERRSREISMLAAATRGGGGGGGGRSGSGGVEAAEEAERDLVLSIADVVGLGNHSDSIWNRLPGEHGLMVVRSSGPMAGGRPLTILNLQSRGDGDGSASFLAQSILGSMDPAQRERFERYREERMGRRRRQCLEALLEESTMIVKKEDLILRTPLSPSTANEECDDAMGNVTKDATTTSTLSVTNEGDHANDEGSVGLKSLTERTNAIDTDADEHGNGETEANSTDGEKCSHSAPPTTDAEATSSDTAAGAVMLPDEEPARQLSPPSAYYAVSGGGGEHGEDKAWVLDEDDEADRLVLRIPLPEANGTKREKPTDDGDGGDEECDVKESNGESGGPKDDDKEDNGRRTKKEGKTDGRRLRSRPYRTVPNSCAICLSPYKTGSSVTWSSHPLRRCPHAFHTECVLTWLAKNDVEPQCPCCRRDFVDAGELRSRMSSRTTAARATTASR